ncbi:flagellar biosynthesis anti-sigma factor FlgM [Sphingomonas jatrophae]|uniref:Negative regulator of flagellin synthesis n=1 Tax=Sphingomonas jatrophae TaxID=1166337 RepID=A0A1I6MAU6_9SPHN|nr:flagellar biosynthesis anti-sigma factor FlgM [Sphingomonas jatrophae]SFS12840.1 anti-sigma-28 factor, FlgM family [Sphingomonas jatrophae]
MVDGIGPTGAGRIGATQSVAPVAKVSRTGLISRAAASGTVPNPAADLAAFGPPVDATKVAQLKKAIAAGSYAADPSAIADKMIELDLPAPAPASPGKTDGKAGGK